MATKPYKPMIKVINKIELPEVVTTYKCCNCKEFKVKSNFRYHPKCTPYPECVECEFSFEDGDYPMVETYDFRPLDEL
jgi:hypothetical protein